MTERVSDPVTLYSALTHIHSHVEIEGRDFFFSLSSINNSVDAFGLSHSSKHRMPTLNWD